jgi:outer membrane protein assembly factor BamB
MTKLCLLLLAIMIVALVPSALIPQVSSNVVSDWPQDQNDAGHTGYSSNTGPTNNAVLWNVSFGGEGVISSAVISNNRGYVCVSTDAPRLICFNALTGDQIWSFTLDARGFSPVVANGIVYVADNTIPAKIYAVDATTGASIWNQTNFDFLLFEASITAYAGNVYFCTSGMMPFPGRVYCLDGLTGAVIWGYYDLPGMTNIYYALAAGDGNVFFGDNANPGVVYCLDASTGAQVWNVTLHVVVESSPIFYNGAVYISALGDDELYMNCLFKLNATDGWGIWEMRDSFVRPAIHNEELYVCHTSGTVARYDAESKILIWSDYPFMFGLSPVLSSNGIIYFCYDGGVCAMNATDGLIVWTSYGYSQIALANGNLYVTGYSSGLMLYCFGEATAPSTWTLTVSSGHDSPSPSVGEHLYNDSDTVECNVTSPVTESGHTWNCTGWTGTGSAPASGSSTDVSFNITENSTILWNWEEIVPVVVTFNCDGLGDNVAGPILAVDGENYTATNLPTTFYWVNSTLHTFRFYSPISAGVGQQYMWNSTSGLSDQRVGSINATVDGNVSASYTWTSAPITPDQWAFEVVFGMFRWIFVLAMLVVILIVAMRGFEFAVVAALISVFMAIMYLAFLTVQYDLICALLFIGVAMIIAVKVVMDET